jgi:hypothetical protein
MEVKQKQSGCLSTGSVTLTEFTRLWAWWHYPMCSGRGCAGSVSRAESDLVRSSDDFRGKQKQLNRNDELDASLTDTAIESPQVLQQKQGW